MPDSTVKLKSPKGTRTIKAREDQVAMYESQGWTRVEKKK